MKDDDLTQKIIGCAYKVHNTLGNIAHLAPSELSFVHEYNH